MSAERVVPVERKLYAIRDAAYLLGLPTSTLRWWLEGQSGRPPVIRVEATGSNSVTWGEFIEAGFLREYRRRKVPLPKLRAFIDALREQTGLTYPLAHQRPLIGAGRRLLLSAQQTAGLEGAPVIYELTTGQLMLDPHIEQFVEKIDFAEAMDMWAERLHPVGRGSPVIIDPRFSFGQPTVKGIRTAVLAELVDAGEDPDEVAEEYELEPAMVRAATAYEWQLAA